MDLDSMIKKIQELQKNIAEVEKLLEPRLHVCTQSGKSIVPIDTFIVDGVGTDEYMFIASHRGDTRWNILGAYKTQERALQVYKEMLQCEKSDVYIMPPK